MMNGLADEGGEAAAIDEFVAARQAKKNELQPAQDSLRKALTVRQEAAAIFNG